jgi:hypothetical protein
MPMGVIWIMMESTTPVSCRRFKQIVHHLFIYDKTMHKLCENYAKKNHDRFPIAVLLTILIYSR